ncbi:hypothetical protein CDAR_65001 [Caerostris darwini]|uniref:Uncharacterized protein n=1 Tax=Caerostris darwini TaxID=1538125 RepID=A0AAV4W149_9ARAC|nr:hypothetical protein CDAR_65001 [Caerostris darwini]
MSLVHPTPSDRDRDTVRKTGPVPRVIGPTLDPFSVLEANQFRQEGGMKSLTVPRQGASGNPVVANWLSIALVFSI